MRWSTASTSLTPQSCACVRGGGGMGGREDARGKAERSGPKPCERGFRRGGGQLRTTAPEECNRGWGGERGNGEMKGHEGLSKPFALRLAFGNGSQPDTASWTVTPPHPPLLPLPQVPRPSQPEDCGSHRGLHWQLAQGARLQRQGGAAWGVGGLGDVRGPRFVVARYGGQAKEDRACRVWIGAQGALVNTTYTRPDRTHSPTSFFPCVLNNAYEPSHRALTHTGDSGHQGGGAAAGRGPQLDRGQPVGGRRKSSVSMCVVGPAKAQRVFRKWERNARAAAWVTVTVTPPCQPGLPTPSTPPPALRPPPQLRPARRPHHLPPARAGRAQHPRRPGRQPEAPADRLRGPVPDPLVRLEVELDPGSRGLGMRCTHIVPHGSHGELGEWVVQRLPFPNVIRRPSTNYYPSMMPSAHRPARYVPLWGKRQYRVENERPFTPFEEQVRGCVRVRGERCFCYVPPTTQAFVLRVLRSQHTHAPLPLRSLTHTHAQLTPGAAHLLAFCISHARSWPPPVCSTHTPRCASWAS